MAFLEPGIVGPDSPKVASYNVAKSFYQTNPDVFNLKRVSEVTGIEIDEVNLAFKGCMMIAL